MLSQLITFEHPLNERMRTFLRVEFLFQQLLHEKQLNGEWSIRSAIMAMMEIINLLERTDLITEIMKELERHIGNLQRLANTPTVDRAALNNVIHQCETYLKTIQPTTGRISQYYQNNDFLSRIRQRQAIPGGTCCFDLPEYHFWLHLSSEARKDLITAWIQPLQNLQLALSYLLNLTRQSSIPKEELAVKGLFHRNLNPQHPSQIVRISVPRDLGVFPEVSAGKHRVNVRFLKPDFAGHSPTQSLTDVGFEFSCCSI